MKTLILGNGFIASHLPYPKITERLEPNSTQIRNILEQSKPDCVINTIGYCGVPNIDACELNKEKTIITNTVIPILLALECDKLNIRLLHISSGCLFYGESPNYQWTVPKLLDDFQVMGVVKEDFGWKETNHPNPQSFYSKSKYAADLAINLTNHTILRIRMPVSEKNHPRNLINKLRGYKRIIDIPNSMTFTSDLVRAIEWVIEKGLTGIYHVTNSEPLTAAQIMKEYQKYVPEHTFEIMTEQHLDQITQSKRSNCLLDCHKLVDTGFIFTPAKQALEQCMADYIKGI